MPPTAELGRSIHNPGTLSEALSWVGSRFGPIVAIDGVKCGDPHPEWWIYTAELSRKLGVFFSADPVFATGGSIDGDEALRRVLGEAVERYCSFNSFDAAPAKLLDWSANTLSAKFPRCSAEESCAQEFKRISPGCQVTHSRVSNLQTGEDCWIPSAYVHLDFVPSAGEAFVAQPASTGSAFRSEIVGAVFAGLCEVAERDAIMKFWWNQVPLREIEDGSSRVPERLASRVRRIGAAGLTVKFFDMSTDFRVPAVFCLLISERYPFYTAGASCQIDPASAMTKALDEAVVIRHTLVNLKKRFVVPSFDSFDWIKRLEDHAKLYASWKQSPALDFLLDNDLPKVELSELQSQRWYAGPSDWADLQWLAAQLEEMDLTVLWTDITSPEAHSMGHCVKVVVPQMVPLSKSHNQRYLASPRLSRDLGSQAAINPYPHPFA